MTLIQSFQFLRPEWLWLLLPAGWLVWRCYRLDTDSGWKRLIAPHLYAQLIDSPGGNGTQISSSGRQRPSSIRSFHLLAGLLLPGVVALAGPSWGNQPSPLEQQRSAQVIVVYLGDSMLAQDIAPTRLERSVHKLHDLMQLRAGAPTALVAYAGSAHRVIPLTTDHTLVNQFARDLQPELMPLTGNAPQKALALADRMLEESGQGGSILLLTDQLPPGPLTPTQNPVAVLAMAAPPGSPPPTSGPPAPLLDRARMSQAAAELEATWAEVTIDDSDVQDIARDFDRRSGKSMGDDTHRPRDVGYPLVFFCGLVALLAFRRGWVLRW